MEEVIPTSPSPSRQSATRTSSPSPSQLPTNSKTTPTGTSKPSRQMDPSLEFAPESHPFSQRTGLYQLRPFRGMWNDVARRIPFYVSDWTEGFRKGNRGRVVGATVRMYFLNLMPAIAYILDMNVRTAGAYGINEGLLASVLGALVFSVLSVQPLTIVGITGLINLFNYTVFDILAGTGVNYLQFQAWVLIWSAITHWIAAIFNWSDYSRFITDMVSETFGLYVGIIYIQLGVELLIFEFEASQSAGWFSVVVAILFALAVYFMERTARLPFGPLWARKLLTDYAFALCIIFFTGFVHFPGEIREAGIEFLPITRSFYPSTDRAWLIPFWQLPVQWVFAALPFGILVTLLFYFDNNVSSLMAQSRQFPIKRPAGFHWDLFLLGCTTIIAGILGLPAPNGLVPQAPVHTEALCVTRLVPIDAKLTEDDVYEEDGTRNLDEGYDGEMKVVVTRVVEQRVSHAVMGLLALGTMSGPLLVVLGLMSKAMFGGVFLVVGWGSVEGSGILHRFLFLLRDRNVTPRSHPLFNVKRASIAKFIGIQLVFVAAMVAISETIAGIGFPLIILLLIPIRFYIVPRFFTAEELVILDSPTANSPAVLVSIGGPLVAGTNPSKDGERRMDIDSGRTSSTSTRRDVEEGLIARRKGYEGESRKIEEDLSGIEKGSS